MKIHTFGPLRSLQGQRWLLIHIRGQKHHYWGGCLKPGTHKALPALCSNNTCENKQRRVAEEGWNIFSRHSHIHQSLSAGVLKRHDWKSLCQRKPDKSRGSVLFFWFFTESIYSALSLFSCSNRKNQFDLYTSLISFLFFFFSLHIHAFLLIQNRGIYKEDHPDNDEATNRLRILCKESSKCLSRFQLLFSKLCNSHYTAYCLLSLGHSSLKQLAQNDYCSVGKQANTIQ